MGQLAQSLSILRSREKEHLLQTDQRDAMVRCNLWSSGGVGLNRSAARHAGDNCRDLSRDSVLDDVGAVGSRGGVRAPSLSFRRRHILSIYGGNVMMSVTYF